MEELIECTTMYKFGITTNNYLSISDDYDFTFEDDIVKNLLKLTDNSLILHTNAHLLFNKIPNTITKLILNFPVYNGITLDNLPSGLKELYILTTHGYFNKPINNLPPTLEILGIESDNFNQSLDYLPKSLKELTIQSNVFCNSLDNLPPNLEQLTLLPNLYEDPDLNGEIAEWIPDDFIYLPNTLKKLTISKIYNLDEKHNKGINLIQTKYPNLHISVL